MMTVSSMVSNSWAPVPASVSVIKQVAALFSDHPRVLYILKERGGLFSDHPRKKSNEDMYILKVGGGEGG